MLGLIKNALFLEALIIFALAIFFSSLRNPYKDQMKTAVGLLAISSPLIAFFSPNLLILNAIGVALIPVLANRSHHIGPLYIISLIIFPDVYDKIAIGGVYLLDYSIMHSIGIGAILALFMKGKGKVKARLETDLPFLAILMILIASSSRDGTFTNVMREMTGHILSYALPYFIVSRSIRSIEEVRLAMVALAAAAVILSVICFYEAFRSWPLYRAVWYHYGIDLGSGASVKQRAGFLRSPGPYVEPLSLAYNLTLCSLAFYACRNLFISRIRFLVLGAVLIGGVLAPQSRGAWLGLGAAIFAADLYRGQISKMGTRAFVLLLGGVLAVAASGLDHRVAGLIGLTAEGAGTLDYRENLLDRGIEEFWKSPILGEAPQVMTANLADLTQGEGVVDMVNSYLFIALVSGAVGLLIFLTSLGGQIAMLWGVRSSVLGDATYREPLAFAFSAFIAIVVMIANTSIYGRVLTGTVMIMGLSSVMVNLARRKRTTTVPDRPTQSVGRVNAEQI